MRKIAIAGMTAALALSATACNINVDTKHEAAAPTSSTPATSTPTGTAAPRNQGGTGTPTGRPTAATPQSGGQQIRSKWGQLRYLAPGKFTVGGVVFFTATDTTVVVAGGTCPDGSTPSSEDSKCGVEGLEEWAQASPHNVNVRFSGQTATVIQETQ